MQPQYKDWNEDPAKNGVAPILAQEHPAGAAAGCGLAEACASSVPRKSPMPC